MTTAEVFNYIGLFGAGLYILAYTLLQVGYVGGNSTQYVLMNLTAAAFVAISLTASFNAASLVIQLTWIAISIYGLTRMHLLNRRLRFSPEEEDFLAAKLPNLPKAQQRQLLDNGLWLDGNPGAELTVEGEPVTNLIYLHDGSADVILNGQTVATCPPGSFIGELTVLNGEPATATVRLNSNARYLVLNAETVRKMASREQTLAMAFEVSFARDLKGKLAASNQTAASLRSA